MSNPGVPLAERGVILLEEDCEDDVFLIRRAFEKAGIKNPLFVVRNGEEVLAYLQGTGRFSNREEYPLPDLLLLDLKMPRMDGFEALHWLRRQPGFSSLRVVVLTSSEEMRDVNKAYGLGANSFMVKPMDFQNVVELGKLVHDYWLIGSRAPETSRELRKPHENGDNRK